MTQLSPLMWMLIAPLIITLLFIMSATIWWKIYPQFTAPKLPKSYTLFSKWNW